MKERNLVEFKRIKNYSRAKKEIIVTDTLITKFKDRVVELDVRYSGYPTFSRIGVISTISFIEEEEINLTLSELISQLEDLDD